ncbi:MAG TPA: SgcJ/EcaC family oxidoreductase [Verrucomicrobiae bacterium]|nr:SgcJ/EcaC family oxidoreductase [Verrucomicrobiae bacterium]
MSANSQDEQSIRQLVATWMLATKSGDTATVLSLMTDDVLFMVPGAEPFGKQAFATQSAAMRDAQIDGQSQIKEIQIAGDLAWMRSHLKVTITRPNEKPMSRSGYTLTILKKNPAGHWQLHRDANLLAAAPNSGGQK